MFCWETLRPVKVTSMWMLLALLQTMYTISWKLYSDVCGLFLQDNVSCHKAKLIQEWFEEDNNEFEVLT